MDYPTGRIRQSEGIAVALVCSKCGCPEIRRSVRRYWEWFLLGILLPYRCAGCNRRFFALRQRNDSNAPSQGSLATFPVERRPMGRAAAASAESPKQGHGGLTEALTFIQQ